MKVGVGGGGTGVGVGSISMVVGIGVGVGWAGALQAVSRAKSIKDRAHNLFLIQDLLSLWNPQDSLMISSVSRSTSFPSRSSPSIILINISMAPLPSS